MMTGEHEVKSNVYRQLADNVLRCEKNCQVRVASVGQRAAQRVGVDLVSVKRQLAESGLRQSRGLRNGLQVSRSVLRQEALNDKRQYDRVAAAEALVLPVPETLLNQAFDSDSLLEVDDDFLDAESRQSR